MKNVCTGKCKIYFPENSTFYTCPKCGSPLETLPIDKTFIACKWDSNNTVIPITSNARRKTNTKHRENENINTELETEQSEHCRKNVSYHEKTHEINDVNVKRRNYEGIITSYKTSSSQNTFFDRLIAFFTFRHSGYTKHTIKFRDETDKKEYSIVFNGEILDPDPEPGSSIRVEGRPSGLQFRTERIFIDGSNKRLKIRNETPEVRNGIGPNLARVIPVAFIVLLLAVLYLFVTGNISLIKDVIQTYFVVLVIVSLVSVCFRPLNFLVQRPVSLLVVSLIGTLVKYNFMGLGSIFSVLGPSLLYIGIIIIIIIYIIRGR